MIVPLLLLFISLTWGDPVYYNINGVSVGLRNNSQTISFLAQQGDNSGFSFTPNDTAPVDRQAAGYHHLGDITFRVRPQGSTGDYTSYTTSTGGPTNVNPLHPPSANVFAAADLTPVLASSPLHVTRTYSAATDGPNAIEMWFTISNPQSTSYELGSFGMSMIFNNDWTGLTLDQTAQICSITDPYIGGDHGWVKVSHMTGLDGILLVTSLNQTTFEGWRMITEDPTPPSGTFEGFYEWMVHTEAWAVNEWQNNQNPWIPPTNLILKPGDSVTYGVRLSLVSQGVQNVDEALATMGKAVVQGVPGYVLSTEMETAYLQVLPPRGTTVQAITESPSGSLSVSLQGPVGAWAQYKIAGVETGRSRLAIQYSDGSVQIVQYFVLPPLSTHVASFGAFLAKNHWYTDTTDPFARAYSFMGYDYSVPGIIVQEPRSFIAGLSDEAGAGSGLGISMKNQFQPVAAEVQLIDTYINKTLWGTKLDGFKEEIAIQGADWTVKRSMFYSGMPNFNYTVPTWWAKNDSQQTWRSYNYPHPTAVYWSMYKLARNYPNLIKYNYPAQWYLTQAANTFLSMWNNANGYAAFGLMVGSVHKHVIDDLKDEGLTSYADQMITAMQSRTETWASLPFPFGSEFPWDSTGQEEIYTFTQYFGVYNQSNATLAAVLAYMPSVPNWAYHGSAKRYWDFGINGKIIIWATERALHHYGSGINAIPVLSAFRANPDQLYLLQVGIGAISGVLTNIQANSGMTSMAFHADPSILAHDPYYADYGVAFYGHAQNAGCYVILHPTFGYLGYLCDVTNSNGVISIIPRDTFHQRVYIASIGLYITLETGTLASLQLSTSQNTLTLSFTPNSSPAYQYLRVKVEVPTIPSKTVIGQVTFTSPSAPPFVRNAYQLPSDTTDATLSWTSI